MKYPLLIEKRISQLGYDVTVPDLPGCKATANTIDEAFDNIQSVIKSHLTILSEYGESIPRATSIEKQRKLWLESRLNAQLMTNEKTDVTWGLTELDITPYLGKSHKINVTLPELLINQIDSKVSKSLDYKTRSGFIAAACLVELQK